MGLGDWDGVAEGDRERACVGLRDWDGNAMGQVSLGGLDRSLFARFNKRKEVVKYENPIKIIPVSVSCSRLLW